MPTILYAVLSTLRNKSRLDGVLESWATGVKAPSSLRVIGDIDLFKSINSNLVWPCAGGTRESYRLLPYKVLAAFRIALTDPSWQFIFKVDDDTFVAPNRLEEFLKDYDPLQCQFIGYVSTAGTQRFASGGGGYVLSRPAILKAWSHLEELLSQQGPEDLLVATAMERAGVELVSSDRFGYNETGELAYDAILVNDNISAHYVLPENQKRIWEHLNYLTSLPFSIAKWRTSYGRLGLCGRLGYENKCISIDRKHALNFISAHAPSDLIFVSRPGGLFRFTGLINDSGTSDAEFNIFNSTGVQLTSMGIAHRGVPTKDCVVTIPSDGKILLSSRTRQESCCHSVWKWELLGQKGAD